jgi:chromosome segregation ATPase
MFRNFDYAVTDKDGVNKILARNDQTSFLTKHLRIYGGTGEYGDYRIGRLLRNFTFSGKGLVDNPANPRSHITSFNDKAETSSYVAASATLEELNISNKENSMADAVVYTKEQYEALKAELDQFKAASQQTAQKEIDNLKAQITELTEVKQALSTELEASKEVSSAKETKVVALEAELTETKSKLAEAEGSIKEAELKAVNAARKSLLLERVDEAKAENLIQKFANASQEMFDALVDSLPKKVAETEGKCAEDEMSKEDEEEDKSEGEVTTDLDDAKADDDAIMSSGGTQEEETIRSKASAWFSANVLRTTHKKD